MRFLIIVLIPYFIYPGSLTKTFTFNHSEIISTKIDDYDLISFPENLYTAEVGCPALPQISYTILLPPTAEIISVEIIGLKSKDIPGSFNILPAQKPQPLSFIAETRNFTSPNPIVYGSADPYPGKLMDFTPTGCMSGYRLANISLYPLQYIPREKRLKLYTEITLKINYEEGRHEMLSLSKSQVEFFGKDVKNLVINPEDISRWSPGIKTIQDSTDYLIITGAPYVSILQPVAYWRTKKGYYTKILATDSIYPRYPGRDNAEKVRNCIKDYWQNKGTKWVLLAGDISVVPHRTLYVNNGGTTDYIPSDLYYADLQWSYDGNRNNIFGEFPFNGDTVDLYYDIYLGRASIDTISQANTFVLKDTIYEKRPELNYMIRLFLPGSSIVQDSIARLPPVPPWIILSGASNVPETLRTGVGFTHFFGPSDDDGFSYCRSSDVYGLTNANKYIVANSVAGRCGAFDRGSLNRDCFAENFLNAPEGGAVGAIFNSRISWGGSPFGPSEMLILRFYTNYFKTDTLNFEIGKVHAMSKDAYRNSALNQAVWRWCYYELNLFGDPELPMWGLKPCTLVVSHSPTISRGPQNYPVTVRSGSNPLGNALVCLWKGDEVYARGLTDASGNVTLSINPLTDGPMLVTATAKNHLPYESSCIVGIEDERIVSPVNREIKIITSPAKKRLAIRYSLADYEKIEIKAFDVSGRFVAKITDREYSGTGEIIWRPANLPNGVYFIQIQAEKEKRTENIIFLN